jgi:dihydroflavonol-4-reductase
VRDLVTGATGFVGRQVARALVSQGHEVRVLRRRTSTTVALDGLPFEHVYGDILEPDAVRDAVAGCDRVFHVAALSSYWRARASDVYRVNVEGTRIIMDACLVSGVPRVIHTSSVAAIGVRRDGRPSDETQPFDSREERFAYAHSKHLAEQEVRRAIRLGLQAVIVNPAVVIGPGDHNLISGSLIVEMARRPLPACPPGGICTVDIDAVVQGHLAAAEQGRVGERYILGGENLTYREITAIISDVIGGRAPAWTLPSWVIPPAAVALDAVNRFVRRPMVSGDQLRFSAHNAFFDSGKAIAELGYRILPFRSAAEKAYRWYMANGYLSERSHHGSIL